MLCLCYGYGPCRSSKVVDATSSKIGGNGSKTSLWKPSYFSRRWGLKAIRSFCKRYPVYRWEYWILNWLLKKSATISLTCRSTTGKFQSNRSSLTKLDAITTNHFFNTHFWSKFHYNAFKKSILFNAKKFEDLSNLTI